MRRSRRQLLSSASALGVLSLAGTGAAQAPYPSKPITLVMTFAAGGGGDVVARIVARHLTRQLGQPVNVLNRPGGNSIPGILAMLNAPADGYTLLYDGSATSALQALITDLPYPLPNRSWGPILAEGPYFYAVNAKSPHQTLAEFAAAARASPEAVRMAWLGGSSFTDATMVYFLKAAGIDVAKVRKVPFNGSGPAATALAGGHIDFAGGAVPAVTPFFNSGDVRVLALSGNQRHPAMPDVPTSQEAGIFVPLTGWSSLSAPPRTPVAVMARLEDAVQRMTADPEYGAELARVGSLPRFAPGSGMWAMVEKEVDLFRELQKANRLI